MSDLQELKGDQEYTLVGGPGTAIWITVGNISVKVKHEDEGVVVDTYAVDCEDVDFAHLNGAWTLFDEATATIEEYNEQFEEESEDNE